VKIPSKGFFADPFPMGLNGLYRLSHFAIGGINKGLVRRWKTEDVNA